MINRFHGLLHVTSADADIQRRGRILIIIALGMSILAVSFMVVSATSGLRVETQLILSIAVVTFLGAAYFGRIGHVNLGAYIVIGVSILSLLVSISTRPSAPNTPTYLILVVLLAGVLLTPKQIWVVFAVCAVSPLLVYALLPADLHTDEMWQSLRVTPLLLLMASLIMFISARSTRVALTEAQVARAEAETASRGLAASNASLESRVAARTAELTRVLEDAQTATRRLEESLAAQRDMNHVISELSVPIIPITHDALVVPLVGAIDSARANQLLEGLLGMIERMRARTIIVDVTGVAVVDTQVAASLLRIAAAARLMGAETVLVGIRPEVAQTLVGLGVDLESLHTAASLQDGLAFIGGMSR